MRKKLWLWIAGSVILLALLFIGLQQWGRVTTSAESMSQEEAEDLVEKRYKGEITKIEQKNDNYIIEMDRKQIIYEIKLNASNGEVLSFSKIGSSKKENEKEPTEEKSNQEVQQEIVEGGEQQTSQLLTESAVKEIALKQVKGTVDDIDLESSGDLTYYLVEIETADDREAVVSIHASTGKILSVSFDD
ncbi:PepSY domain-containing protein [Cytobacillus massiliigabonensis]|uniref:PepSY domain-containing protein n=1 Tax=Cytobacillus massiliigabonensis TaxID=1871011 RepID=UPI000C8427C9|nr:PepSY domain-containing protein [Cytobacillus massiliigabonensis]